MSFLIQGLLAFCDFFGSMKKSWDARIRTLRTPYVTSVPKKRIPSSVILRMVIFFFGTDVSKTSKWFQILSKVHFLIIFDTLLLTFWKKSKVNIFFTSWTFDKIRVFTAKHIHEIEGWKLKAENVCSKKIAKQFHDLSTRNPKLQRIHKITAWKWLWNSKDHELWSPL